MTIAEKVAYLKGLADGYEIKDDTKEWKILAAILDVLEDIAYEIEDIDDDVNDISDELDAVWDQMEDFSDELDGIEEIVFDEDEDEDEEDDECDDDCCCCDDDDFTFEATCPECDATIAISEDALQLGKIVCPSCGEELEFEFEGFEDEEDEEYDPEDGGQDE